MNTQAEYRRLHLDRSVEMKVAEKEPTKKNNRGVARSKSADRWAGAGKKVLSSLAVSRALLGERFDDVAARTAAAHKMKEEGDTSAAVRGGAGGGGVVALEGAFTISSGCFVADSPHARGGLAMPVGAGNSRVLLHGTNPSDTCVAIDAPGEFIVTVRAGPGGDRMCCGIGLDDTGRIAMYKTDAGVPWP
eukprot:COSAG06_NODE_24976_length_648_cov_0.848816_1_plen_189_part_01